eukprot:Protomagalhaensia_sp_Gyna_25__5583@NODE_768_length_2652_cov_34_145044_g603_i0_p1_GENE_NODE_768_length_2652_cov_34_145044_g603_i0NODE_768_length_2652_cov_34_145044_g603_i0_p1_ORF_typecomplete_len510_score56_39TMEM43/PF07787_12/1_5e24DUF4282/PF14110_6/14DUF4282/PF14110_6/1_5e02_NODE_768_length_2652_cov_34_145044_g603_i011022631
MFGHQRLLKNASSPPRIQVISPTEAPGATSSPQSLSVPRQSSTTTLPASLATPKFEEFSRAFADFKSSQRDYHFEPAQLDRFPSPVRRLIPPKPTHETPATVATEATTPGAETEQPKQGPTMAPPIAARTISVLFYLLGVAIFLCALAAMLTADFSSGLVQNAIMPLRRAVKPVSCEPLSENDHQVVHIDCPIRKLQTFYPPQDFANNLRPFQGIFFEMRVEMFQYNIVPGMLRSSLGGVWSDSLLPSHKGWTWLSTAKNPDFFPHVPGSGRHFSEQLYGGGFRLDRPHLIDFHSKLHIELIEDKVFKEDTEKPPTQVTSRNTRLFDNYLYTGDPLKPSIGDIRISFYGSAATHVSAVGYQTPILGGWSSGDRALKGFQNPLSKVDQSKYRPPVLILPHPKSNETRTLVMEGDWTAKNLLDAFTYENDVPSRYLIFTRSIGFVLTWIFFYTTHRVLKGPPVPCWPTIFYTLSLVLIAIGITKLTYSVLAATACVLTGLLSLIVGRSLAQ